MKGFKKDGKFRPTQTKTKSSLKKSDVRRKVSTKGNSYKKTMLMLQDGSEVYQEYVRKYPDSIIARDVKNFGANSHGSFGTALFEGDIEDAMYRADAENIVKLHELGVADRLSNVQEHDDMLSPKDEFESRYDWAKDYVKHNRSKETLGHFGETEITRDDKGVLMEKRKGGKEKKMDKFSLFGSKKSDQAKASEEKIKEEQHGQKVLEKQDKVQDKNNQKRAKEIAKHIKFLEKHMEDLEKRPQKLGVNANTQLENLEESRNQKRELQAELDEINKLLEHPQVRHKKGNRTIGKFTNVQHREEMNEILPPHAQEYTGRDKKTLVEGADHPQLREGVNKEKWYFDIKENTWRKV